LTNGSIYRSGAVVLDDVSFTSDQGLTLEFEYDMYGGSVYPGMTYGDGMCLFLYDASAPLTNLPGYSAGALSYIYNRAPNALHQGLNKAYLAVAFDQFGNFKGAGVNIGLTESFASNYSSLTLRGGMRHTAIGADAVNAQGQPTSNISSNPTIYDDPRYQGYPVLFSRTTNFSGVSFRPRGQVLDMNNNSSSNVTYNDITSNLPVNIEIRGGELNPPVTSLNYRKVVITLGPADPLIGGGYYITVDLQNGINTIRVVENFHYKESFYYEENANSTSDAVPHLNSKIYSLNAAVPPEFKIGFGASTGAATQFHLVKNLVVDLAYTPRFEPDYVVFCENVTQPSKAVIDVYANDFVYNGPIYGPPIEGNGPQNIDYGSFKFTDSDIIPFNELGSWSGNILTYNELNQGIWTYDKTTGLVEFTPSIGFSGKAKIFYTAKGTASLGGPFNQDEYYSVPDEIVVEEIKCGGHVNPQLPSGGDFRRINLIN